MTLERQLQTLEARIAHLEAVVDGSEEQTRDATAYIVGIVARFLHDKRLIDEHALRDYVRTFEGDASDREDYMGDLVRRLGHMIDFHHKYPAEFDLSGGDPPGANRSDPMARAGA